jgi:hypothetical protein
MMATNVLALPLAHLVIEVANNEDWIDSLVYLVSETGPPLEQLDLRGLAFEMHIRRQPEIHEIVLDASTADGRLSTGAAPNVGHLIFFIRQETMRGLWAGKYVGDVIARDANFERVVLTIELTVLEGITR